MVELQQLDISKCYESATNPRGAKFEGAEFDELVASVKEKGVLMPILARPQKAKFEIVAGNRRFRAAKAAGLKDIPARVVEMTDIEAREAQIVENLQRADVHPLEEGEAYRQLIEQSEYDVPAVAAKVGKSETYVRDRLILTNLTKPGAKAFREELITAGHAALIARLDARIQTEALDECLHIEQDPQWRDVPTTAELRRWIQGRLLAESMKQPPWANDEEMKAALGGCEECKGKGGDLFGKKAADACTNPTCYAKRLTAYIAIQLQKNPDLVKLTGYYQNNGDLIGSGSYKEIHSKKERCDHAEKGIIVENEGMGRIVEFCRAPECKKHWQAERPGGHYKPTEKEKDARKKAREAEVKKREKDGVALEAAVAKIPWPFAEKHLDALLSLALTNASHDVLQGICKRREWEAKKQKNWNGRDYKATVATAAKAMKPREKAGLVFELLLPSYSQNYNERRASALKGL